MAIRDEDYYMNITFDNLKKNPLGYSLSVVYFPKDFFEINTYTYTYLMKFNLILITNFIEFLYTVLSKWIEKKI